MIALQVVNPMVCHFDLLLDHRHALGEVVVGAHLAGQFVDLTLAMQRIEMWDDYRLIRDIRNKARRT